MGITYPNSTADAFVTNSFGQRVSQSGVSGAKTFTRPGLGVTSALLSDGQADYTPGISERCESGSVADKCNWMVRARRQTGFRAVGAMSGRLMRRLMLSERMHSHRE